MQGRLHITGKTAYFGTFLKIAALAVFATFSISAAAAPVATTYNDTLKQLEIKTWTADESELNDVEHEIVKVMQRHPKSAFAHHLLSHLMVRIYSKNPGDMYILKQASDLAQQSIDLDPRFSGGYASYAHLLDLMGNTEAAVKLLNDAEAAGIEPNWRFYLTRARLTADTVSAEKTLNFLRTALSFSDTQPEIIVPYVIAIINTEKSGSEIEKNLEDWNSKYPSPLFALSLGLSYNESKQYKKAEAVYQSILKGHPDHLEATVNLAVLNYRNLGNPGKAVASLENVLTNRAHKLSDMSVSMVKLHLGSAYLALKQYDKSFKLFTEVATKDPASVGVLDFVTNAYRTQNADAQLARFLSKITRDVAGSGIYYALLGETLSEKLGKHGDAVKAYNNAITLDPSRSDYYNGLGLAIYRGKNYNSALKAFIKATEIDPSDATARYNEACMLSLLGHTDDALNSLAEALTLDPKLTKSAAADSDFSSLRGSAKFHNLLVGPNENDIEDDVSVSH